MPTEPSSRDEKGGQNRKSQDQNQERKSDKGGNIGAEEVHLPEQTVWKRGSGLLGRKH